MDNKKFKILPKLVTSEVTPTYNLTEEQKEFFKKNGYLLLKGLFSTQLLDRFRQRFIDVCNKKVEAGVVTVVKDYSLSQPGAKPEEYINKIQELLYDEVYSLYSEDPRMLHVVSQLLESEDLTAVNCMLINKPPGTAEHPPHQDTVYFPFGPPNKIITTWTAIDPVTTDNGCLYVVPGSHDPMTMHYHCDHVTQAKLFFFGIENHKQVAPEHKRLNVPMAPGDTLLFYPHLVHGSRPNTTKSFRKAMTSHYASSHCHYIEPKGTPIEPIALKMEKELKRRGGDLSYVDLWRIKTKQVKGVRCNL